MKALVLLALVGLDPSSQRTLEALSEPGCPRLFGLLAPHFQAAVPAAQWPAFCDGIGRIDAVQPAADRPRPGWSIYRARAASGEWEIGLAFDDKAAVTGLYAKPWRDPLVATDLASALRAAGERHHLPGLAALALVNGAARAEAAWGVRKAGDPTPVGTGDRWHLGSDTKAMTATLAALLVAEGKISWQSTLGKSFPDWTDLAPAYRAVTLEQLLSHRGGLAHDTPPDLWSALWRARDPVEGRARHVRALLARPPAGPVGAFVYSNDSYITAGVMLERAAGKPWEALMRERLFAPLGVASCGFGPPATVGTVDAPWAHRVERDRPVPIAPGPDSDNPPGVGPAGTVHCSLPDWSRFVEAHLRGERGQPSGLPLDAAAFRKLHAPVGGGTYALGWAINPGRWAGGPLLGHDGSNTLFFASVLAAPGKDVVLLAAANRGDAEAAAACHEVIDWLVTHVAAPPAKEDPPPAK